jgi:hypothetical protein
MLWMKHLKRYDVILYGKNTSKVRKIVGLSMQKENTAGLVKAWQGRKYLVAVVKAGKYPIGSIYTKGNK